MDLGFSLSTWESWPDGLSRTMWKDIPGGSDKHVSIDSSPCQGPPVHFAPPICVLKTHLGNLMKNQLKNEILKPEDMCKDM